MPPISVFIHDYDSRELARTFRLVRRALTARHGPEVAIRSFVSRNRLLEAISNHDGPVRVPTLIDLRASEATDREFRGLRLIETIARDRMLKRLAVPCALTQHGAGDMPKLVSAAGAGALIHKPALEAGELTNFAATLSRLSLGYANQTTTVAIGAPVVYDEPPETVLAEIFPGQPYNNELVPTILERAEGYTNRGIAGRHHQSFEAVEQRVNRLGKKVVADYAGHGVAPVNFGAVANELLSRCPSLVVTQLNAALAGERPQAPGEVIFNCGLPADTQSCRTPQTILDLYRDQKVKWAARLDAEAAQVMEDYARSPHPTDWNAWVTARIDTRIQRQELSTEQRNFELRRLRRAVTRAALGLLDADRDAHRQAHDVEAGLASIHRGLSGFCPMHS